MSSNPFVIDMPLIFARLVPRACHNGAVIGEGEQAPEFSGAANDGTRVSLADWRGQRHVVLFFYARDFTPG